MGYNLYEVYSILYILSEYLRHVEFDDFGVSP